MSLKCCCYLKVFICYVFCPSLAPVPGVACAGVGPIQSGDPISRSVWWLPVRVPGPWCRPEVQEGQPHCSQYAFCLAHVFRPNATWSVSLTLSSLAPVPPDEPVIDGGPEVLLNAGESYNLSCVSRGAKPPSVIEWLKGGLPVDGAASVTVSNRLHTCIPVEFQMYAPAFIHTSMLHTIRSCFQMGRGWPHGATCPSSPSTATLGGTTAVWPPIWLFLRAKAQPLPSMYTVSNAEILRWKAALDK